MTDTPELNVWREASDAATENAIKWKPTAEKRAAAVIRSYGDQRDAEAYQRGKLEGARLAIEAAATVADHHRVARRSAHTDAHRRQAKQQATSLLARSLEAQQLMVAIRALSPAKIVGEA